MAMTQEEMKLLEAIAKEYDCLARDVGGRVSKRWTHDRAEVLRKAIRELEDKEGKDDAVSDNA